MFTFVAENSDYVKTVKNKNLIYGEIKISLLAWRMLTSIESQSLFLYHKSTNLKTNNETHYYCYYYHHHPHHRHLFLFLSQP